MPTRCPLCGDHRRERTVAPYAIGKPSPRLVSSLNSARHRLHRASTRAPPYSMRPLRAFPHAGALSNPHSGLASTEPQRRSPRFPPSRLVQRLPVWRDHVRAQPAREGRHRTTLNNSGPLRFRCGWLLQAGSGHSEVGERRPIAVESTTGAVAVGVASLWPRLSVRGALLATPWLRFQSPLIEPDVQISRIRLSDKTHAFAHGRSRASRPSNRRHVEHLWYACTVVLHTTANAATWANIRSPDRNPG